MGTGRIALVALGAMVVLLSACEFPLAAALPVTQLDIDPILADNALSAQEKRTQLETLGLAPLVINALLQNVRTGNQFGGDLRSAYEKVVADRLDELTPDEVQIYGDEAQEVGDSSEDLEFTDTEAQAIVSFFQDNGISTQDELSTFLDDPAQVAGIPGAVPVEALTELFVEFDSDLVLDSLP